MDSMCAASERFPRYGLLPAAQQIAYSRPLSDVSDAEHCRCHRHGRKIDMRRSPHPGSDCGCGDGDDDDGGHGDGDGDVSLEV